MKKISITFVFKSLANSAFNIEKNPDLTGLLNLKNTELCAATDLT
jgi:hypothetical protein